MRYFACNSDPYEATRIALDAAFNVPEGETVYEPLATAPRAADGRVLLAVRDAHAAMEPFASAIIAMLAGEHAEEVTEAEYHSIPPQPEATP